MASAICSAFICSLPARSAIVRDTLSSLVYARALSFSYANAFFISDSASLVSTQYWFIMRLVSCALKSMPVPA